MSDQTTPELHATSCWDALTALLTANLNGVDVDNVTDKDFLDDDLVMRGPCVRVLYAGTDRRKIDNYSMNYESVHQFVVLAGDENLLSSFDQSRASLCLSERAESILAGARLRLPTNETTEPLTLVRREPLPVKGVGIAFATAIEVPGPQQFAATFAEPPVV